MFLARYRFDGDPALLEAGYDRMLASLPVQNIVFHVAARTGGGIEVWDVCPDRATFERFSTSDEFRAAVAAAGLPQPAITPLGETIAAVARGERL